MHSAATWLLDHPLPASPQGPDKPWDLFAVYYDAIDHFCHAFMKYHPPRQSWISERDFELYGNVVNMAYQFHDQMLGALLRKALCLQLPGHRGEQCGLPTLAPKDSLPGIVWLPYSDYGDDQRRPR